MNQTLFLAQLRVIILVGIAFAAGKGWLSSADSSALTSILAPIGIIIGPWIWSIYSNFNSKIVPQHTVVIDPVNTVANSDKPAATVQTAQGTITGKVVSVLLVAFALSCLLASAPAMAQQAKPRTTAGSEAPAINLPFDPLHLNGGRVTGNVNADVQALWQKIVAASLDDLHYAAAMANSAGTLQSQQRLQCLNAIIKLNEQASGLNLKNADGSAMAKPDAHIFTDVETLAEVVDNLAPTGPLFVSCAGAAQLAKTNVLAFVNAVVTGAAGFAAMPIIPGL